MPSSFQGALDDIRIAIGRLKKLRREIDQARRILDMAATGRIYEASAALRKHPRSLTGVARIPESLDLDTTLKRAENAIASLRDEAKLEYASALETALGQAGVRFAGNFPIYILESVVQLRVNLAQESVAVDRTRVATLDPRRVITTASRTLDSLLRRPFDASAFGTMLRNAYYRCVSRQGGESGGFVAVRAVFDVAKEKIGPRYDARMFGVDLMRLLASGTKVAQTLQLAPARSPVRAVWVPGVRSGYVTSIRFPHEDGPAEPTV